MYYTLYFFHNFYWWILSFLVLFVYNVQTVSGINAFEPETIYEASIKETKFFTIYYFHICHTFMMYKLLLKLTRTVVRNYRVHVFNESFTQIILEFSLQKMRTTSCILQRYKIMAYPPRLFTITHAQRNISSAASRANDMPVYDG